MAEQFSPTPGQVDNLPTGVQAVENRMGGWEYFFGSAQILPGDWMVKTAEGEDLIFPPDAFSRTFELKPE